MVVVVVVVGGGGGGGGEWVGRGGAINKLIRFPQNIRAIMAKLKLSW